MNWDAKTAPSRSMAEEALCEATQSMQFGRELQEAIKKLTIRTIRLEQVVLLMSIYLPPDVKDVLLRSLLDSVTSDSNLSKDKQPDVP